MTYRDFQRMSDTALTIPDRERLVKLCGMLGSDHDGERAAAARKACELLRARKLTWEAVINPPSARPRVMYRSRPMFRDDIINALHDADADGALAVTEWERGFLNSVLAQWARGKVLSEKQWEILLRIYEREAVDGGTHGE